MKSPARSLFVSLASALLVAPALAAEGQAAAKPDLAKGQAAAAVCMACHTADGSRGVPANPILQGQFPEYLAKQLHDFKAGRRKNAVARVWIKPGSGKIVVNDRDVTVYFARPTQQMVIQQPFETANRKDQYDVMCTVKGGGLSGQAGAVRHGISQALTRYEPDLRPVLKKEGFLTRDSRVVERKKYGRAKARRSFQFSKR